MKYVEINDLSDDDTVTYNAYTEADCRDDIDREVFKLVHANCDVITIGRVIGRPVF